MNKMKTNKQKLYQVSIYVKRKAKQFYNKIFVNGKSCDTKTQPVVKETLSKEVLQNVDKIHLTEAFQQHMVKTFAETAFSVARGLPVPVENVSKDNCVYNYLDLTPANLYYIFEALEQKTMLDLLSDKAIDDFFIYFCRNKNDDIAYNVVTVGSICDFIGKKLLQANHDKMLQEISKLSLQHYFKKELVVPQK